MKSIVIHATVAAGKSTFIQNFKKYAESMNKKVIAYEEPIDEWISYISKSNNIYEPLQMRYDNIEDPVIENTFASFVLLTLIKQRNVKHDNIDFVIYERDYTDCKLFRPNVQQKCINMLYDYVEDNFNDNYPTIHVYLSIDLQTSIDRIKKRDRNAERHIDIKYLDGLITKHHVKYSKYLTFDLNVDIDSDTYQTYIRDLFNIVTS